MHRIDAADNLAGQFQDPNPGAGQLGTKVDAAWMNAVQNEICNLLEAMGVTLVKGTNTQFRDACVATATALKLMRRDAAGRAKVADPSAADDIDTKGARDAAITTHNGVTNPHSATAAATADRLVLRDANGRASIADPGAPANIDTQGARDAAIAALTSAPAITYGTGWGENIYSHEAARCTKVGNIVCLRVDAFTVGPGQAWSSVLTLPVGARPSAALTRVPCTIYRASINSDIPAQCSISTSGVLAVNAVWDSSNNRFNTALPAIGSQDEVLFNGSFPVP